LRAESGTVTALACPAALARAQAPVRDAERILGLLELDTAIRRIDRRDAKTMIFGQCFCVIDSLPAVLADDPTTHGASSEK
jgi:hypothetical protein